MATETESTTSWVEVIGAGLGGSIRCTRGSIRYLYSVNQPVAPAHLGNEIVAGDGIDWSADGSRAAIWVSKTSYSDASYFTNLYTDTQAGS